MRTCALSCLLPAAFLSLSTAALAAPAGPPAPAELDVYEAYRGRHPDLEYDGLLKLLTKRSFRDRLSFDPTDADHYDTVAEALKLTAKEKQLFRRHGMVSVDHQQRYSMGAMYFAIYARDLPVLVTTDSILHALHRSYDEVLKQLEQTGFTATLDAVLTATHDEVEREAARATGPLAESLRDVDLYLSVARNLLAGAGVSADERSAEPWDGTLNVPSRLGQDAEVLALVERVASLELQNPMGEGTRIYDGRKVIDYSQFRPRGHYTTTVPLKRYFRAMMWLGRVDTGFSLTVERERRDAAVLTRLLEQSGTLPRLAAMGRVIDFMVGRADELGVAELQDVMKRAGITTLAELGTAPALERLTTELREGQHGRQQIRSQVVTSNVHDPNETPLPPVFQLFGQRFVLDSFVLSKVVFDSILFEGQKVLRMMPSGLDVMAALGNDEAIRLLAPTLRAQPYGTNLMALRAVVDDYTPAHWGANLYNVWLDGLRLLDDDHAAQRHFPEVMQTRTWQRKQLQTQLASWAELRHDTILYAKQSYTAYPTCGYPDGYVEPYPAFYARLGAFAREAARRLGAADLGQQSAWVLDNAKRFFEGFGTTMGRLEKLANKELKAEDFTSDEEAFLKRTIDISGGGSGPPRYDGWYPQLIFGGEPASWKPTIADVHTDPKSGTALEVGVGDANFLVVAINNEDDRAVYVGPAYSYYEFAQPVAQRLTDEAWAQQLSNGKAPSRPGWVDVFQAPAAPRTLGRP